MEKSNILEKSETLNHNQRWIYMIGLGKKSKDNNLLATSLLELAYSKIHYERLLALMSAHGSFDKEIIKTILLNPSLVGLKAVLKLAAKHLLSDQLIELLPRLSKNKRIRTAKALLAEKRTDVIEQVYAALDIDERLNILFFTSEDFFKRHIDQSKFESFSEARWQLMAKHFPTLTLEQISGLLKKDPEPPWLARQGALAALRQFHKTAPSMGLSLLNQTLAFIYPKSLLLERYFSLFPEPVAELILKYPGYLPVSLPITVLRKLKNEVLCALADKKVLTGIKEFYPRLRPRQRLALHKSIGESLRESNGTFPYNHVFALPNPSREEEALYAFNSKLLEAEIHLRLRYLSVLPFSRALTLATPFLTQTTVGIAISSVIQCGRYYPSELEEILEFCIKRKNEKDPARQKMIKALASLPPTRWTDSHLSKFKSIITAALQARDCSLDTMWAATELLFRMLEHHQDFVVDELPTLAERMGCLTVDSFYTRISDSDMVKLDSCLYPVLKTQIKRDNPSIDLSLVCSFGHKIRSAYQLQRAKGKQMGLVQLLVEMVQDKRGEIAKAGLNALVSLDIHEEVSQLIPQLIEQDPSWIQIHCVSEHLHRHRQDLLTPFLEPGIYGNRFSSGDIAVLPDFDKGFVRWTANQQQIYANSINNIINSNQRDTWGLYKCVNRLCLMPSVDVTLLVNLVKETKDIALRDKAIEALGRVDAGRGVPALVEALEDDRARVAIYALRRPIMEMSEKKALALLSKAPMDKVTVAKEIVRLAGEFTGECSYNFLSSFMKDENLHPDLQIALLRAFWKRLDKEEVWDYFHKSAQSEHIIVAYTTTRIPQEGLSLQAEQYLCEHMALLLQNQDARIRMGTLARLAFKPLNYVNNKLFWALSESLEDIDKHICKLAARALLKSYLSKNEYNLADILARARRPKSIEAVVEGFRTRDFVNYTELKNCAESVALALMEQRRLTIQVFQLSLMFLPPLKILTIIENLDKAGLLHPAAVESVKNWKEAIVIYPQQDIDELETKLRASQVAGIRRLGLGLLVGLARQYGWSKEYREHLSEYWADTDLWVSEAAGYIEPV